MALLKSPWGRMSGRLGNTILKDTPKGTIMAAAPLNVNTPMDPASLTRRTKFKFVVKFSAAVIKLLSVHVLWKKTAPAGNRCLNKVFKTNYDNVNADLDLTGVRLTLMNDISVPTPEVNITPSNVQLICAALGVDQLINTAIEKTACIEGVLALSTPLDGDAPAFSFVPFKSNDIALVLNDSLTFNAPVLGADAQLAQRYSVKQVALVLVTKDADGNPVKFSNTVYN